MEKENNPPPYFDPHAMQTGINYPGPQAAYPPQPGPQAVPYQPPPYGFGAPSTTVQPTMVPVITQMTTLNLTDLPGRIICPHCMTEVLTEIDYVNGLLTWLSCGGLMIFMCWFCCCIPFCVNACKDVKHTCPNCRNVIHLYKRI